MIPSQNDEFKLPTLRDDLSLHKGPRERDGSPTWTLHDPVRNRYFRIGWPEFEMLSRWSFNNPEKIVEDINDKTTLNITDDHLKALCQFLLINNLIVITDPEGVNRLKQQSEMLKVNKLKWLLHNYLFLKIPLVKPDKFLSKMLPFVQGIYTRRFLIFIVSLGLLAIYLVMRQWDQFIGTFVYFFSLQGILFYGITLIMTKIIHELGHAFTAKRYGLRVPTMGVAFLVMWPVLYTDTSDAWKLPSRKQRLAIGFAGMASELCLAVLATFLWSFTGDGPLRSALFLVATVTWVLTLIINLNPFMRFDGYYLLSDYLDVQNLQDRSFALGKWKLRKVLFGIKDPVPEYFPPRLHTILIFYAYGTWIYRFFLFLGIALLVYYFFFKVLGIFLMIVELVWFIGLPIWRELMEWWKRRDKIGLNKNTKITLTIGTLLILAFIIPWRSAITAPATLQYTDFKRIFPPISAQIDEVFAKNDTFYKKGDILFKLSSPELENDIIQNNLQIRSLKWQLSRQASHQEILERKKVLEQELAAALTEQAGYLKQKKNLTVIAPFDGFFYDLGSNLHEKRWIKDQDKLGILINKSSWVIQAYISEKDISRVDPEKQGKFHSENSNFSSIDCKITKIDGANIQTLDSPYLASVFGGDIAVNEDTEDKELVPNEAVYRATLMPIETPEIKTQIWRGSVTLYGEPQSFFIRIWKTVVGIIIRESGF